jgi:hypothetical protein
MYREATQKDVHDVLKKAEEEQQAVAKNMTMTTSTTTTTAESQSGSCLLSPPPSSCCKNLNIPLSATTAALTPVLVQCGDGLMAERAMRWLNLSCRQEEEGVVAEEVGNRATTFVHGVGGGGGAAAGATPSDNGGTGDGDDGCDDNDDGGDAAAARLFLGKLWMGESAEWGIGNTANYAMAVGIKNGSNPRALYHTAPRKGNNKKNDGKDFGGQGSGGGGESCGESFDFGCAGIGPSALVAGAPAEAAACVFRCCQTSHHHRHLLHQPDEVVCEEVQWERGLEIGIVLPPFGPSVKLYLSGFGKGIARLDLLVDPLLLEPTSSPPPSPALQEMSPSWTWREVPGGLVLCGGEKPTRAVFTVIPRI